MPNHLKFKPEIGKIIVDYVRAGTYVETAAAAAGVAKATLYNWLKAGRSGDSRFTEFVEQMDQAVAQAEAFGVTVIAQAARDGAWQAQAWLLERRHPERWAQRRESEKETEARLAKMQLEEQKLRAELKLLEQKIADPNAGITDEDEAVAAKMRERFGEAETYDGGKEPH